MQKINESELVAIARTTAQRALTTLVVGLSVDRTIALSVAKDAGDDFVRCLSRDLATNGYEVVPFKKEVDDGVKKSLVDGLSSEESAAIGDSHGSPKYAKHVAFLNALRNFEETCFATAELVKNFDNEVPNDAYPFHESFDELYHGVLAWLTSVEEYVKNR